MTQADYGLRGFQTLCGRKRAAFWRAQGFPNLVLARAALAAKRARERNAKQTFSPFALSEYDIRDLPSHNKDYVNYDAATDRPRKRRTPKP